MPEIHEALLAQAAKSSRRGGEMDDDDDDDEAERLREKESKLTPFNRVRVDRAKERQVCNRHGVTDTARRRSDAMPAAARSDPVACSRGACVGYRSSCRGRASARGARSRSCARRPRRRCPS